ncbi:alpha-L-fucosidase [Marinilactibacillus sp. XAAS-LB27]|uniref:alpha-L-fucosidase n=1 Tax=Marinilactibacillus sp. XAAS-LB27 TaxID=3114538 RepID=UPI002E198470|nr:alpha-L-fucosidase [Marinilactibacillus sp. XAAS-LB27]
MGKTYSSFEEKAINIRPSKRQLLWQETEFYGFIHFSINTFTEKQWGDGRESPLLFDPSDLDVEEWIKVIKSAGMKGLILTCKHHDGFCLWPSLFTEYSVKNSPYLNGSGDIVKEVSEACLKHGIKFGVYLSPWDRHDKRYGQGQSYNDYFCSQLTELVTQYGELFSIWFDGACGEGENGRVQRYDWERYYDIIRLNQPNACISVCGPDVRWCGNESGATRDQEWSIVPEILRDAEKTMEQSQTNDQHADFIHKETSSSELLGDRKTLKRFENWVWYPCEVNLSIRPSWFYSKAEDNQVKSVHELLELYYRTVGGNTTLLLNIPPDKRGRIHENDKAVLTKLGKELRTDFQFDLLKEAKNLNSQSTTVKYLNCQNEFLIHFDREQSISRLILQEEISKGQRVESFKFEVFKEGNYESIYQGSVIGYKTICRFEKVTGQSFRLSILESREEPLIRSVQLYE